MENISNNLTNVISWDNLREEGLQHLQALSGHIWTDYNIHDPGVTILELLCYAIADLDARLSQDISVILTENNTEPRSERFFSPGKILTINPVTINDYRKLLIDLPGVKNAWIVPVTESEPALYYDQDNNVLLYDYAPGSQRITLHGLYRVFIEKDENVQDDEALRTAALRKLHAHRNLGEDFEEVNVMAQETISVFSDIQIDENANADEVMGVIYYDLKNFISPRVKQYSLKRMLQKGKTIEQIFTGPQLENGFIDDDELGIGAKRQELHTSDLIRIIMAHPEVKDVRNLYIANVPNPDVRQKQEWALPVDTTKALLLEKFNGTKIRLFKNETLCPVSSTKVAAKVAALEEEHSREIFDDPAMDLTEELGDTGVDLTEYSSIEYKLPAIYGVSETGLPSTASALRRSQTKQLRAYLLFFEQILVNYLKQLDSFKSLFAFRQNRSELLKSYFAQLLPEELWEDDFPEIAAMVNNDPTESLAFCKSPFNRRNHILDHLLAQFNEKFADYALFGYQYNMFQNVPSGEKERYFLNAKAGFLESYPELSHNRNRAFNYWEGNYSNNTLPPTDGLKNLIAAKLGINLGSGAEMEGLASEEFYIVEHILFRPEGSLELGFVCSERIPESFQPDPYSYRLTFVIPSNAGRFGNSKFKELAYNTIANETPAHIAYSVLEFNSGQMKSFTSAYHNFLAELLHHQQGDSVQYNLYRRQLMEFLGIGRPKLPVLHLNARNIRGDHSEPANGTAITEWFDLSCNNHHGLAETTNTAPIYIKANEEALPFLSFDANAKLRIENPLVGEEFSIVAVFKTKAQSGSQEQYYPLIAGVDSNGPCFSFGFSGNGDIMARLDKETIMAESEAESFHIAEFIHDQTAGMLRLYLDGVIQTTQLTARKSYPAGGAVEIAPGAACELGEVIVLDSVLTGSKKQKLEAYLSEKWRVPLSAVSSIAKPALHLDATASKGVIKDEKSSKVSEWSDLSEERIAVAQADTDLQPVYLLKGMAGLPALSFNDAALENPNAAQQLLQGDFTIAVVYQAEAGEGRLFDGIVAATDSTSKNFVLEVDANGGLMVQWGNQGLELDATLKDTHMAIISAWTSSDGPHLSVWLDGKSYTDDPQGITMEGLSNSPATLVIGRSRSGESAFHGMIGEMVIYHEALSAWDRQRLQDFWAGKWQIGISGVDNVVAPVLHLDASRLASVRDESGAVLDKQTKVYQWLDLEAGDNHAVQNNANRRPTYVMDGINHLGAIKFTQEQVNEEDFYEDSLNVTKTIQNDFTIMAVFQPDDKYYEDSDLLPKVSDGTQWTEGIAIIDADCSGRYNDFGLSFGKNGEDGNFLIVMGGIGDRLGMDNTIKSRELSNKAAHFITFTREKDNGVVKLYVDGLLHAQADLRDDVILNDSRTIKIGAFNSEGRAFHGLIGEIVIFDQVLNDWQRQRIEEYLSAKWGIAVQNLPVDSYMLNLHLDVAVATNIAKDTQDRVAQWFDGKDVIALQEQAEYQPLYAETCISGLPALQFNNSLLKVKPKLDKNDLEHDNAPALYDDLTLAIVFQAQTTGNIDSGWDEAGVIDHYDSQNNNFGITITRNNTLRAKFGAAKIEAPVTINKPHIAVISRSGGLVKIFLNGLIAAQGLGNSQIVLDELTIGAIRQLPEEKVSKGYYHGALAEVILFKRALSERERQSLEQYLALKWRLDISGINSIAKPILHLDASQLATVVYGANGHVSAWLDRNGHRNSASQTGSGAQPYFLENTCNGLGVLHFDHSWMTLNPPVIDDFAVIIVYRAEKSNIKEYMPVADDAFTVIDGIDSQTSANIRHYLKDYIDDTTGRVLPTFTPGKKNFNLNLSPALTDLARTAFEGSIKSILRDYNTSNKLIPEDAFCEIAGVTKGLSQTIWLYLLEKKYLNNDGKVLNSDYPQLILLENSLDSILTTYSISGDLVPKDAFCKIAGVTKSLSQIIWSYLLEQKYLSNDGQVLNSTYPARTVIESGINSILGAYCISGNSVPKNVFCEIVGVTLSLSETIWMKLLVDKYLDNDGKALQSTFAPGTNDFGYRLIEIAVIDVILAKNWLGGAGLFDGNCAGERGQLNKRDFGMLVGKDGQITAGIGVPDEKDYQLTRQAPFNTWHIAILTRRKDTGETRLYVDNLKYDEKRVARNISLKDPQQFTIGAVNTGGNYFSGDIAEIIVLDQVLNENQISMIERYLTLKWSIVDIIYIVLSDTITASINEEWQSAELQIEVYPDHIGFAGYYFSTGLKKGIEIKSPTQKQLEEAVTDLLKISANGSIDRWNRAVFKLALPDELEMEYIWDQDFADQLKKDN